MQFGEQVVAVCIGDHERLDKGLVGVVTAVEVEVIVVVHAVEIVVSVNRPMGQAVFAGILHPIAVDVFELQAACHVGRDDQ